MGQLESPGRKHTAQLTLSNKSLCYFTTTRKQWVSIFSKEHRNLNSVCFRRPSAQSAHQYGGHNKDGYVVFGNVYMAGQHQEKLRGQRGRLPVQPLGYVMSTKVIFRRAEVFVLAKVCLPIRPHADQPRSDV